MTIETRKARLEAQVSEIVGTPVEITIRGERKFTFSVGHIDQDLEFHLVQFFGNAMSVESVDLDEECGTFVYMTAA